MPDRALSRVSSYDYLTTAGLIPVGNLVIGAVSAAAGIRPALVGMTVLGVLAARLVAGVPSVRGLPRPELNCQLLGRAAPSAGPGTPPAP